MLHIQTDGPIWYISEICLMVCVMVKIINNVCSISEEYLLVNVTLTIKVSL